MATVLSARRGPMAPRNPTAGWRHLDLTLVVSVLLIAGLGLVMVYSATRHLPIEDTFYLKRQAIFTLAGIGVMGLVASVDYRVYRDFAALIYVGALVLLLLVLTPLGSSRKGAQAWFQLGQFQLQPSEWAKLALIVCIAAYCTAYRGDLDARRTTTALGLAAVPMVLIQAQPDLGTAMVFVAILMGTLLVAGARPRHMGVLVALGIIGVAAVLQLGLLKEYQRDRLGAFLDPSGDPARSYNLNQSKIAIANGGLTGKGLFEGTQTKLAYVPEQHTDFIFTVVGEELGLIGSGLLLTLFALVVWRTWRAAALAKDACGTVVCIGVLAMFVFQIFENVGMTMGIMPIAGIPLPFMSYGGSATLASFAAAGLVLNVHMRRFS